MAKIRELNDFKSLTSNITSFSHAYLFNTNSLKESYPYLLEFTKMIICDHKEKENEYKDICYQIENNEFDDVYVINPSTISINTEEINKLFLYMETKSIRKNGRRVYIISGFERLSRDTSNRILKFLEEPDDNIYALLITEHIDKILPTIISRCQIVTLTFDINKTDDDKNIKMQKFINVILDKKSSSIAYINDYFSDIVSDRLLLYDYFEVIEKVLSDIIIKKTSNIPLENDLSAFSNYPVSTITNILDTTNRLKNLIKQNINLNLLLDRYIIEVTKELSSCKK